LDEICITIRKTSVFNVSYSATFNIFNHHFQILHAREAVVAALAPHGGNPAKGAVVGNGRGQQQGKDAKVKKVLLKGFWLL